MSLIELTRATLLMEEEVNVSTRRLARHPTDEHDPENNFIPEQHREIQDLPQQSPDLNSPRKPNQHDTDTMQEQETSDVQVESIPVQKENTYILR
ncbi:hypothetical protein GJ496_004563 [Pomphorhynchus laevis]|nr:hypothetical protein GJ496_004563 [Pomphorhynchus laevis]